MTIRFNQRSQKFAEAVQPRPTCAEKVRRLGSPLSGRTPNLLTSPNLNAQGCAPPTHTRDVLARTSCVCVI